jgi:hypothetical protein
MEKGFFFARFKKWYTLFRIFIHTWNRREWSMIVTKAPLTYGRIDITFECEKCGKENKYSQLLEAVITNQGGNVSGDRIFNENLATRRLELQKKKEEIFSTYNGLEHYICSNCGYSQSWMRAKLNAERKNRTSCFISVIALPVLLVIFFGVLSLLKIHLWDAIMDDKNGGTLRCVFLIALIPLFLGVQKVVSKQVEKRSKNTPVDPQYPKNKPVLRWELIDKLGDRVTF